MSGGVDGHPPSREALRRGLAVALAEADIPTNWLLVRRIGTRMVDVLKMITHFPDDPNMESCHRLEMSS
jgi:hypothetical protein